VLDHFQSQHGVHRSVGFVDALIEVGLLGRNVPRYELIREDVVGGDREPQLGEAA